MTREIPHEDAALLRPVAPGAWVASEPVRIVGMRLSTNMTVLRLANGELLLHSPVPMRPHLRAAVEALGPIAHLYAPNTFHHLWIGDWSRAFPNARLHAPAALARKRPDLRIDRAHDVAPEPAFEGALHEQHIDGLRLEETVLVHAPSGALVCADLVQHIGRPEDLWTALYSRAMGFYDRIALSRVLRSTAFSDRRAARRSLDALFAHPFDQLLVAHGTPVSSGGPAALAAAYAWLPAAAPLQLAEGSPSPRRWFAGGGALNSPSEAAGGS